MEYSGGKVGRVFAARFRDGEDVYQGICEIARRERIASATVLAIGGARRAKMVVGPKRPDGPIEPMVESFDDAREIVAVGSLHLADAKPSLHLHAAIGRGKETLTGCPRLGLEAFLVLEVFILEIEGLDACRKPDPHSGLSLLSFASPKRVDLPAQK